MLEPKMAISQGISLLFVLFDLILYVSVNILSDTLERVFLGLTSTKLGLIYQRNDAGEARTFLFVDQTVSYLYLLVATVWFNTYKPILLFVEHRQTV